MEKKLDKILKNQEGFKTAFPVLFHQLVNSHNLLTLSLRTMTYILTNNTEEKLSELKDIQEKSDNIIKDMNKTSDLWNSLFHLE